MPLRTPRLALSERPDGPGMGLAGAAHTAGEARRAQAPGGQPLGGDHRQLKCQGVRKRGVSVDPVGFDAGKKTKGVKRHVLTDHQGLLLSVAIHPASVQDRDGMKQVLTKRVRRWFPFIEVLRRCGIPGAQCSRDGGQVGRVADRDR